MKKSLNTTLLGSVLSLILPTAASTAFAGTLYLAPATSTYYYNHPPFTGLTNFPGIVGMLTTNGSIYNFGGDSPLGSPTGMAVDTNGFLYISYPSATAIIVYTPSGQSVFSSGVTNGPGPLTFDAAGNLYSANPDGSVSILNTSGTVSNFAALPAAATALACAANSNLYALIGQQIYVVSNKTVSLFFDQTAYDSNGSDYSVSTPNGLAIDSQGNIYLGAFGIVPDSSPESDTNEISKISPAGVLLQNIVLSSTLDSRQVYASFAGPVMDQSGYIYLSSYAHESPSAEFGDTATVMTSTNGGYSLLSFYVGTSGLMAYSPFDAQLSGRFTAPTITRQPQPQSQTVGVGATVSIGLSAVGGPLWYQWYFNDTNASNPADAISGATNSILTLTNVQVAQAGLYTVVVSNVIGPVISQPAQLSVLPSLKVSLVPAVLLQGGVGITYDVQYVNIIGPTNALWQTLAAVTLTNTSQFYSDYSAIGQPARFYRLMQVP